MSDILLSVLVISHNQKEQIRRCLDSILSQNLTFEYEIIVSDDSSSDGTWEVEQEYATRYSFINCYQCCSDDCKPSITSERSGYNRSNAFSHSSGKYFVHIDADDWYRPGTDCLFRQVELLEQHPECSMCMQGEWCWKEGSSLEQGNTNHGLHRFHTGEILQIEDYYKKDYLVNSGVMMYRRQDGQAPTALNKKWYVDNFITAYYQQFGPIVCLDRNDWIYTQTPDTITNHIKTNDRMLLWGLDSTVFIACLIPTMCRFVYVSDFSRSMLLDAIRCIKAKTLVSQPIIDFCQQFSNIFVFRVATKSTLSSMDKIRLNLVQLMLKHCEGKQIDSRSIWSRLIHIVCTK